jgi:uncharacterized repeat protein (TIGR02543 family)
MFKKRNLIFICLLILGVFLISGCWLISTPTHTVTYDSQGGSAVDLQTVERGGLVIEPTAPTQTGYAFAGWYKENAWVFATDTVTANVTLYAKWAQWTINTYTVTFNSQGGSAVSSQTVNHGGKVSEPTNPTRTGYTFGGWYKESGCTNAWVFATDTVTANVTLYAKWTINSYTVTYDGNGHTAGTVPVDPSDKGDLVKTDHIFDGWNTQADGTGADQAEGSTFPMGISDMTLYAKWAAVINIAAIPGVTAPVTGANPVDTITATAQYTGTIIWAPTDDPFLGEKIYTATITLTAKTGFTLTGVAENFFTVAGATADTNPADSGIVTAVFPATALAVGDSYGGGIVAYILQPGESNGVYNYDENVQHGLIAATDDQSEGIQWYNGSYTTTGAIGTALGTGSGNTTTIIGSQGATATFQSFLYHGDQYNLSKGFNLRVRAVRAF